MGLNVIFDKVMKSVFIGDVTSSVQEIKTLAEAEEKIKMLAERSVFLNDFVRMLCNGAFGWAAVVLLGRFASHLPPIDFWLVSFILVTQFIRQKGSDKVDFDERKRQGTLERFDLVAALDDDLMVSKSISIWRLIQRIRGRSFLFPCTVSSLMAFASTTSAGFRLTELPGGDFDFVNKIVGSDNGADALFLLYFVAVMEGILSYISVVCVSFSHIIIENLSLCKIFGFEKSWGVQVICAIGYSTRASIRRGTPIENLKIEVLPFALGLFREELPQHSHFGVLILSSLARGKGDLGRIMRTETLDAIISKPGLVDRLLAMVSCREPNMEHIRLAAAQILLELWSDPKYHQSVTATAGFYDAIQTLSENLTDFCPSSPSGERVQKRHCALEPKLKEIGSEILGPPPPTPSASSPNAPAPPPLADVSGSPPESEQQQCYRYLALQNQQQRYMIRTLHIDISGFSPEQQQSFGPPTPAANGHDPQFTAGA